MGLTSKGKKPSMPKATSLRRAAKERDKWLIYGDWKHGKTSFALSVLLFWQEQGYDPETCSMVFIDCDDGIAPIVEKWEDSGLVKGEYLDRVRYYPVQNFREVEQITKTELPILRQEKEEHGADRAWMVVDNSQAVWEWARDHYALMTYGKMESEVAAEKRHEAIVSDGKTSPTFSPRNDYGIINPIHNNWADAIKFSGVSFIWLAPQKEVKEDFFDEDEIPEVVPAGQKGNPGRVDHIVRVWRREKAGVKGKGKYEYFADIVSSRKFTAKKIADPSYELLRSIVRGEHPAIGGSDGKEAGKKPALKKKKVAKK